MNKAKDWALVIALAVSSISSFKFKYDEHGVQVELERTQQKLAEAEAKSQEFGLAGVNCD